MRRLTILLRFEISTRSLGRVWANDTSQIRNKTAAYNAVNHFLSAQICCRTGSQQMVMLPKLSAFQMLWQAVSCIYHEFVLPNRHDRCLIPDPCYHGVSIELLK